jgi:hypothetical protein
MEFDYGKNQQSARGTKSYKNDTEPLMHNAGGT